MRAHKPVIDLLDAPEGHRVSQLLFGEAFTLEKVSGTHSFGRTACGYQGWVPSAALAENRASSHHVSALASFVYTKPDMKSELRLRLPFGARVKVLGAEGLFARTPEGYIFAQHLSDELVPDFTATAERFIGVPYLWGGRSSLGIDCSGLAQIALQMAGREAPRDSTPQSKSVGDALAIDAPLLRGDLVFWRGHVGIMQDPENLLHATAFSMTVMSEPLATAIRRIEMQEFGEITAIRRL